MKRLVVVFICVLSLLVIGCDKIKSFSTGDIDLVKNHIMESIDKNVTIGQAIHNYKYFKQTKWELVANDKGTKIVQVTGYFDPSIKGESFKNAFLKFKFHINKNKEINLAWCGIGAEKLDGFKIENPGKGEPIPACLNRLEQIYKNTEFHHDEISFFVEFNYRLQTGEKLPSTRTAEPTPIPPEPPHLAPSAPPPLPIASEPSSSNIQAGKIYTYKDKKGVIIISNVPAK